MPGLVSSSVRRSAGTAIKGSSTRSGKRYYKGCRMLAMESRKQEEEREQAAAAPPVPAGLEPAVGSWRVLEQRETREWLWGGRVT